MVLNVPINYVLPIQMLTNGEYLSKFVPVVEKSFWEYEIPS